MFVVKRDLPTDISIIKEYALSFLLKPYRWAGDDFSGIDCSGLVQEILMAAGIDPVGDQTAQTLFNYFMDPKNGKTGEPQLGALAFYGESHMKITHVAFCMSSFLMIEAGGGGSKVNTVQDAIATNAFVRIRPILRRKDLIACILPKY